MIGELGKGNPSPPAAVVRLCSEREGVGELGKSQPACGGLGWVFCLGAVGMVRFLPWVGNSLRLGKAEAIRVNRIHPDSTSWFK